MTSYVPIINLIFKGIIRVSRVAQRKRAGPITQRSEDQNLALLVYFSFPIFSNFFLIPFFFLSFIFRISLFLFLSSRRIYRKLNSTA